MSLSLAATLLCQYKYTDEQMMSSVFLSWEAFYSFITSVKQVLFLVHIIISYFDFLWIFYVLSLQC